MASSHRRLRRHGLHGRADRRAAGGRRARGPCWPGASESRLAALAERLGGLEYVRADAMRQNTVFDLVGRGDVLISTVGPFVEVGRCRRCAPRSPPGCTYLDTTGEPEFIRRVFEEFGPPAARSGAALLTAMGYDFAPGALAGALALDGGGRGRGARRRRLLRARRRADVAVGGHARVARRA